MPMFYKSLILNSFKKKNHENIPISILMFGYIGFISYAIFNYKNIDMKEISNLEMDKIRLIIC